MVSQKSPQETTKVEIPCSRVMLHRNFKRSSNGVKLKEPIKC